MRPSLPIATAAPAPCALPAQGLTYKHVTLTSQLMQIVESRLLYQVRRSVPGAAHSVTATLRELLRRRQLVCPQGGAKGVRPC